MQQNLHQAPAPMIPVPQQLTISPSERHPMYDQSLLHNQQQHQQYIPMNQHQQGIHVNNQFQPSSISPTMPPIQTPEKKSRTRSKKPSIDSRPVEIPPEIPPDFNLPMEIPQPTAPIQQTNTNEDFVNNPSINVNNGNNLEENLFVSTSIEEEQKDIEKLREDRGDSRSPSVGSSSAKSESVIKEIPLSGERHRLSRSKSPKSRWHHSPSPHEQQQQQQQTNQSIPIEEQPNSALLNTNDDKKYI